MSNTVSDNPLNHFHSAGSENAGEIAKVRLLESAIVRRGRVCGPGQDLKRDARGHSKGVVAYSWPVHVPRMHRTNDMERS
jgi:hypothetical protein